QERAAAVLFLVILFEELCPRYRLLRWQEDLVPLRPAPDAVRRPAGQAHVLHREGLGAELAGEQDGDVVQVLQRTGELDAILARREGQALARAAEVVSGERGVLERGDLAVIEIGPEQDLKGPGRRRHVPGADF